MTSTPTQDILSGIATFSSTQGVILSPFGSASISDSNDSTDVVTAYVLDDDVVTGTLDAAALPAGSYVATSDGSLLMLSGTAATVQADLRALRFDPGIQNAGVSRSAHLTIILTNTADSQNFPRAITSASVQSTGVNVAVIGVPTVSNASDSAPVVLLPSASVLSANQDLVTVQVSMSDDTLGRFETDSLGGSGAVVTRDPDGSVTLSGSAATVTAGLRALGFVPVAAAAGTTGHETFTIASTDTVNGTTATTSTALDIAGSAPVVTIAGVAASASADGGADIAVFAKLVLNNLSAEGLTATVAIDPAAGGTFDLGDLPYGTADGVTETLGGTGATLTLVGSTAQLQADLAALRLRTVNPASGSTAATVSLSVTTASNQSASVTEQLSIASSGSAPVLAGNGTVETSATEVALYPTASVSGPLTAVDATITLSDPSVAGFDQAAFLQAERGNTEITARFSADGSGLEIDGDAAGVTSALRLVQLTPASPATAIQSRETATLSLAADAGTMTASTTILVDGPALVADAVSGIPSDQAASAGIAFTPFAQAVVTDANVGDRVTAVVTAADAAQFGTSGLAAGSVTLSADGRVATITGSAAIVQSDLRALTLVPAIPISNLPGSTTLGVVLSNAADSARLDGNTVTEQVSVAAPATYGSDTGADDTGHVFSVFSDPARIARIDLTANPNRDIVVFGGNSALDLTAGHSVVVLNGTNQNGAAEIHSLGDNAVWVGAAPIDYVAGGASRFILGDMAATSSSVSEHGGASTDSNEFDVWGDVSETQTIVTDGTAKNLIFGGHANLAFTGGNAVVVLNGNSQTGAASIQSEGGNTIWAGTSALDVSEGAGDDTILLSGGAATTIHGSGSAETGTTRVLSLGNSGAFTDDGGAKAALLQLAGGTNVVHGGAGKQTISIAGTGSLLVSDDQTTTGAQSIVVDQGFSGTMRFLGGGNPASLQLGGGTATVTAGTATTIAGGAGSATIDLSAAVGAVVDLDGSLVGKIDIMGFDPTRAGATLTHVASTSVAGGNLVVGFDDGAQATFHGYADPNHAGISFG
jgi:hypothetical protein